MAAGLATELRVVTTTLPSREAAEHMARAAVEEHLAACCQVQGPIMSIYRWNGALETATEWYCHFKTTEARLETLEARLIEWHPYEVPEIIALPVARGTHASAAWVAAEVQPQPGS